MEAHGFDISDQAITQAKRLGIGGNVSARLARMARRAANLTHPLGNRRFDEFVLRVDGNKVKSIDLI
jgi:hypothetical protein